MEKIKNMVEKITLIANAISDENIQVDCVASNSKEATLIIYNMRNQTRFIKTLKRVADISAHDYAPAIYRAYDNEYYLCNLVFIGGVQA